MKNKQVEIGNATLYCGDSFRILPKLDLQADAIISDPPFGITNCKWDKPIPLDKFWAMVEGLTKQSANFVLFGCSKFTVDLINSNRKWYRYDLTWQKTKKCGFLNSRLMPMRNHEQILVFGRPGFKAKTTYNAQKIAGGKPYVKTTNHKSNVYQGKGEYTHISDGTLHPGSVLYFKSETGGHSTMKPIPLMEFLVRSYTNENDVVIDPFCGSGSTGIACIKHNRRFIGIERDKKFFDIAVDRIEKAYAEVCNG
jgi:site-specific DNA-methyltransferase (adenine-specific)